MEDVVEEKLQEAIARVPGAVPGRCVGTAFGSLVWAAAVSSDFNVGISEQTRLALEELERLLAELGSKKEWLLSVTVYLSDMENKPGFDDVWSTWVGPDASHWPQRACIEGALDKGVLVELVAVAARLVGAGNSAASS